MLCAFFFFSNQAGANAIEVTDFASTRIYNNFIRNSAQAAVAVSSGANSIILENHIEACGQSAVVVSGRPTEASVILNRIAGCRSPVVKLERGGRAVVFANTVYKRNGVSLVEESMEECEQGDDQKVMEEKMRERRKNFDDLLDKILALQKS